MSDVGNDGAAAATVPSFTERELQMLGWAMQSLKSGPPEVSHRSLSSWAATTSGLLAHTLQIDYEKLAGFAGMGNPRSASNAWAKIRGKLQLNSDTAPTKNTPKKKAAAKKDDSKDGDEGGDTPKKTPRKRAAKKQEVDGGDVSPKKKGRRPANAKQVSEDETGEFPPSPTTAAINLMLTSCSRHQGGR